MSSNIRCVYEKTFVQVTVDPVFIFELSIGGEQRGRSRAKGEPSGPSAVAVLSPFSGAEATKRASGDRFRSGFNLLSFLSHSLFNFTCSFLGASERNSAF